MVKKWRGWWFDGKAGSYMRSEEAKESLEKWLDEDHWARLQRDMDIGFNSLCAGKVKPYSVGNAPSADAARLKILQDFLKQAAAKKSFLFSSSNAQVKGLLLEGGVCLNPMMSSGKFHSDGRAQLDEEGHPKARPIVNASNRGHPMAPNSTSFSFSHSVQVTTSQERILRAIFRLEALYPKHILMQLKEDISDAFRILHWCVSDLGTYSHEYDGVVNVNLSLVFGGASCPSAWEAWSSAAEVLFDRMGSTEKPDPCQLQRQVDDFWLLLGLTASPSGKSGVQRLQECINMACGDVINIDKQTLPRSILNVFGIIVDLASRTLSTPWSKVLKLARRVEAFNSGEQARLSVGDTHKVAGLAQWVYQVKPPFMSMLQSWLGAILLSAQVNGHREASPALPTETPEQGWSAL